MKIVCPKCKGRGEYIPSEAKNPLFVIATLGLSLAMTDTCEICRGTGFVYVSPYAREEHQ